MLAMSLWFSTSAVATQLQAEWGLSVGAKSWLTISVQIGFVVGTLISALLNLADRFAAHRLVAVSALLGAAFNAAIALLISDSLGRSDSGFVALIVLRGLTGAMLAGVYPPGMKLMASWFKEGRGLAIGVLVGALTIGSASPHLINALPLDRWSGIDGLAIWRLMMLVASGSAVAASLLTICLVRPGPLLAKASSFQWNYIFMIWKNAAVRRANFGYFGHQWELYAMWSWVPLFLSSAYTGAGYSETSGRVAGFSLVAIGGIGCVVAGLGADRLGRTRIAILSLVISGGCALGAGFLFDYPQLLTAVCLLWGFAVVADSAQFSTAVTELCEPGHVGTALTIQTCVGFLITTATIWLIPLLQEQFGWGPTFATLAVGPLFGIWHMARLRRMPEAVKMASGNR